MMGQKGKPGCVDCVDGICDMNCGPAVKRPPTSDPVEALKKLRAWLAVEECHEQVIIADEALLSAGIVAVACHRCDGAGEWDEGPLPGSSGQIDPEYHRVVCPECRGSGSIALAAAKTGGSLDPIDTKTALENGDSR